ncbi:MAG: hypothetical protein GX575_07030 [Candidatus Anammoximicrobium sp.]|nr:hypothetical protein [Candidatus Anammoximicrobium sp.]
MRTRHGGFSRTASYVSAALLACGLLAVGHPAVASDCECGADAGGYCCPQTPRLEEFGGWSLFWHDPCTTPTLCWAGEHDSHLAQAPQVYVSVDFLPLFRDGPESNNDATAGNDDDVEFQPGIRALVGVGLSDWYRLEFSSLALHSWKDSCYSDNGVNLWSELDNSELNVRRRIAMPTDRHVCAEMSWLVGLRYMQVDEESSVTTENDLFGAQIGALAQFLVHDRAWIDFEIKGAMFMNEAEGSGPNWQVVNTDCTSFLGDLSLQFNYQFAPSWTIRAGYNAMWLTGVALAGENNANNQVDAQCLDHDGDVVYHGPNIGLIWAR